MVFDNYFQFFNSNLRVYIDIDDTDNCGRDRGIWRGKEGEKKGEKEVKKEDEKREHHFHLCIIS